VSVCGTGTIKICLAGFLGSLLTLSIRAAEALRYFWGSASTTDLPIADLPTPFNEQFRLFAELSLLLHHFALYGSTGILTGCPSTTPFGFALGPDLPAVD
jgi:hypothetical protein